MLSLFLSVVLSSWLILSFKVMERYGINRFQAIVFNYITCVITGCLVKGSILLMNPGDAGFRWSLLMGSIFITLFNITGFTAQKVSVAAASVANKLSMVIPFVFSIYLYHENVTVLKIAGILMALAAVYCIMLPAGKKKEETGKKHFLLLLLPVILFIGSGLQDTVVKYIEQHFMTESNSDDYLITAFVAAASWGSLLLVFLLVSGKQKFSYKALLTGISVGVPNYFSIWFLVKALKEYSGNSSAVLPVTNIGILLFTTLLAWLVFREHLSAINKWGVLLSVFSILLIAFG